MQASPVITLAAAGLASRQVSGKTVTHLLIMSNLTLVDADKLHVALESDLHERMVLVNNVSCLALAGINDFYRGSSQAIQTAVSAATGPTDFVAFACLVDLGRLDLNATKSRLEVALTWSQAGTVHVVACNLRSSGVDFIKTIYESALLAGSQKACESAFVYYSAGTFVPFTDAALNDVQITVNSDEGDSNMTLTQAFGLTMALGDMEAQGPQNVVNFYRNEDQITGDIGYNITGSDADSDLRIITIGRLSRSVRMAPSMDRVATKLEGKLIQRSPQKQAILATLGGTTKKKLLGMKQTAQSIRGTLTGRKG